MTKAAKVTVEMIIEYDDRQYQEDFLTSKMVVESFEEEFKTGQERVDGFDFEYKIVNSSVKAEELINLPEGKGVN